MHRDEVGTTEEFVERQQLDAQLRGTGLRHVRVIRRDVRAECGQPLRHQLSDAAETDHPDGLAEDLGARERRPLPGVGAQRGVGGGNLAGGRQHQRQRVLGGAVDVRRRRVDHQNAARRGGVDVDVVQADARAGDDLQLRCRGQDLGVHDGGRTHQQRVGIDDRGQQLLPVGSVHPADFDMVAEGFHGRFGQLVGDQYNRQTHADSLVGCNGREIPRRGRGRMRSVDITVVGSGPNGLAAAVICARAGLSVQVIEAQSTAGGGARTLPDPEFPGVSHDICSAVHPLALASPFFAAFDLPARGVRLSVPDVSYGNPLPDRAAAIGYRDIERTCAELDDGASWRQAAGSAVGGQRRRGRVAARRQAFDPAEHRGGAAGGTAAAGPGQPCVGLLGG